MTNELLAVGYTKEEAFKRVEQQVNPVNQAVVTKRKDDLSDKKNGVAYRDDYKNDALNNFKAAWYVRMLPGDSGSVEDVESNLATSQIAQLTSDYKTAYESQYLLTGSPDEAKRHADGLVKGLYGVTDINGKNQVMRYAPENYLSIPNVDNKWMKEQVLTTAKEYLADSFDGANPEDVILVADPLVTSSTAKEGNPKYRLMLKWKNGELHDLLGQDNYFEFDPSEVKEEYVNEARTQDQLKKARGGL